MTKERHHRHDHRLRTAARHRRAPAPGLATRPGRPRRACPRRFPRPRTHCPSLRRFPSTRPASASPPGPLAASRRRIAGSPADRSGSCSCGPFAHPILVFCSLRGRGGATHAGAHQCAGRQRCRAPRHRRVDPRPRVDHCAAVGAPAGRRPRHQSGSGVPRTSSCRGVGLAPPPARAPRRDATRACTPHRRPRPRHGVGRERDHGGGARGPGRPPARLDRVGPGAALELHRPRRGRLSPRRRRCRRARPAHDGRHPTDSACSAPAARHDRRSRRPRGARRHGRSCSARPPLPWPLRSSARPSSRHGAPT